MKFVELFFSYWGRVGRMVFLTGIIVNLMSLLIVFFVADTVRMMMMPGEPGRGLWWLLPLDLGGFLSIVSLLSLHVRRVHDRDIDGRRGVVAFVMIALAIALVAGASYKFNLSILSLALLPFTVPSAATLGIVFFHLGYIRGPEGANRYGPDPRDEEKLEGIAH